MNEVLLRRLLGAGVLLLAALIVAALLPDSAPRPEPEAEGLVVYDLAAPTHEPAAAGRANPPSPSGRRWPGGPDEGTPAPATPAAAPKPAVPIAVAPPQPAPAAEPAWYVQIGSFSKKDNALAAIHRMRALGHAGEVQAVVAGKTTLHRVRIGPYRSRQQAEAALRTAESQGFRGSRVLQTALQSDHR